MLLRHLVYVSRLVDPPGPSSVPAIIRNARANNAIHGITGALLFDGERFCQYIEGDPAGIVRLFGSIEADGRHTQLRVLASGESSERRYGQWTMAYVYAVEDDLIESLCSLVGGGVVDAFELAVTRSDADL